MSKEKYHNLCLTEENIPIFSRDWWLDTVCGKNGWDVLLSENHGLKSAMPLYIPKKGVISMPDFTQTMGIWFGKESADMKSVTCLERRQAICRDFIKQISDYKVYMQNFDTAFTDWLPFYWADYSQTTRYTYRLLNIADSEMLFRNMSIQTRRNLRHANNYPVIVKQHIDIEDFIDIIKLTYKQKKVQCIPCYDTLRNLIRVSREHLQGDIFGGYDLDGNLHAVAFVVWQPSSAYYIAGGGDPAFRHSCAHSLVMLEAIKYTSQYTNVFDFEGSMIQGVERFFREFGAVQTPYFRISKGRLILTDRILIKIGKLWKK